ncbi:MAG: proline--tRNA ligase, partial [Lachnospiraceae bacterium]|nr:proline--tRNA ligase [Lachnospiraceae bacterium]
ETKLRNLVGEEIYPAEITEDSPLVAGYIGPYGISEKVTYFLDVSLAGLKNVVAGANKEGYHYTGLNLERDLDAPKFVDISKIKEGGICPCCGKKSIAIKRGIEVGNIFQLGTKYTETMNMQYTDENGELKYPIMGCYGIGVGRLAASICEAHHDEYGPIWPITIAPWEVQVCLLRADDAETKKVADELYENLQKKQVEVIYDDREGVRPGAMFSDADLLGVPVRVVVSPRNLKENVVEITTRDKSVKEMVPVSEAMDYILSLKQKLYDRILEQAN